MRCPACGVPIAAGAVRCGICGHVLPIRRANPPDGRAFVGRETEMTALRAGLDEALGGRGRLFFVLGEPGGGKTRLTAELAQHATQRGARVLVGRAWETEGAPPFWPWTQVVRAHLAEDDAEIARADIRPYAEDLVRLVPDLRELLPGLASPPDPESEPVRFRLFERFARFLETSARRRPLVLVLDDLHWFDGPSLSLLEFLTPELAKNAILVIGAYREVGLSREHPLGSVVGAAMREPGTRTLELGGLGEREVMRLVEDATGESPPAALVKALVQETGGNPFFLTEIVRLLVAERWPLSSAGGAGAAFPVPHGVRAVVSRRLQPVSAACRKVLTLAAMLGREWSVPALDALGREFNLAPTGDWLTEATEEAVEARLVAIVPQAVNRYAFTHALLRETLYEELNPARRARLHREIAHVLERLSGLCDDQSPPVGAGSSLPELAYHHFHAIAAGGDVGRAVTYALRAGDWAMSVLAWEQAAPHYRRALEALDLAEPDEVRRCELLLRLGQAESKAGNVPASEEAFERAASLARRLRAAGEAAGAACFARAVLGLGGEWWMDSIDVRPRFLELLEEALGALDPEDSALRSQVMSRLVIRLYYVREARERRRALSDEAVAMARRVADPTTLALALGARHWALWDPPHVEDRLLVTSELLRIAEGIGSRELAAQAHFFRVGALLERAAIDAVDEEIEAFARLASELRQPTYQWWTPMLRAMRALLEGRLAEAERLAEDGLAVGRSVQGAVAATVFGAFLVWLPARAACHVAVVASIASRVRAPLSSRASCHDDGGQGGPHEAREEANRMRSRGVGARIPSRVAVKRLDDDHGGPAVRHDRIGGRRNGIPARRMVFRALMGIVTAGLAVASVAGCARTSVQSVDVKAVGLPRPQLIVVHDFGVSANAVALDTAIGARVLEAMKGTPEVDEHLKIGHEVAGILTQNLVKEIGKLGIPAVAAANATPVAGPSLQIEGQFLTVDQGNRLRRAVIGFGAGASEVRTMVQVFETTNEGRRLVEDFYTTVKSSRKPGFGPMAGAGAAAGRAAESAGVSAGVGLATARSQTVEGDARNTADEIVKVLKQFFTQQGWIAP